METVDQYREFLLDHGRHPRNVKSIARVDTEGSCKNPICGDHVVVQLSLDSNQLNDVAIKAMGCTISVASASLMSELIKGKTTSECLQLLEDLRTSLTDSTSDASWPEELRGLISLSRLRKSPTRVPCALIGWLATADAIRKLQ